MTTQVPSDTNRPNRVEPDQVALDQVFRYYDIDSVDKLEHRIAMALRDRDCEYYEPTEEFRKAMVTSFQDAYLQTSGKIAISDALDAAIEDATYWVQEDLDSGAPLESAVCPRLSRSVAMILPAYANRGLDSAGSLQFGNFDNRTPSA